MLTRRDLLFAAAGVLASSAAAAQPPKPVAKPSQPRVAQPKPKAPVAKKPVAKKPAAKAPVVRSPAARRPAAGAPAAKAAPPIPFDPVVPIPDFPMQAIPVQAVQSPPTFHRLTVGTMPVTVLHDGAVWQPDVTRGFVGNAGAVEISAALNAAGIPGPGMYESFNPVVLETASGLVLIDTGFGAESRTGGTGQAAAAMKAAGINMADVRIVLLSRFHPGHIGGLVGPEGLLFPNAEIKAPQAEWSYWTDQATAARAPRELQEMFAVVRRQLGPYAARVERFVPGSEVAPGISAIGTAGPTPGHTSFLVMDGTDQLVILGDIVPAPPLFLAHPEWTLASDTDPALAAATRMALLDRMASDSIRVIGYRFAMPAVGRIERSGTGYRLLPANA